MQGNIIIIKLFAKQNITLIYQWYIAYCFFNRLYTFAFFFHANLLKRLV